MNGLFLNGLIRSWLAKSTKGDAGLVVQAFPEANAKRGTQWEASRYLQAMALNQVAQTILLTGSQTIDLKSRVFAYSGTGVIGRIYKGPTYTGGSPMASYNMNTIPGKAQTPLFQILTGMTVTANGTECGAPIYAIGANSPQGKGSPSMSYAGNRILAPNTAYLLTIESLDSAQDVASHVTFYEGVLDLLS